MTDYARTYRDFAAQYDGMTVSDLPIPDEDACQLLNMLLSMSRFQGGFSAIGNGKAEMYFSVGLPELLTTEADEKEILLKLDYLKLAEIIHNAREDSNAES